MLAYFAISLVLAVQPLTTVLASQGGPPKNYDDAPSAPKIPSPSVPRVFFKNLRDEASVTAEFTAEFGAEPKSLILVKPMGEGTVSPAQHAAILAGKLAGSGHFTLIIDGRPVPDGQPVPEGPKIIHFTKGETQATVQLTPGRHTLTLQLADGAQFSYGPKLSDTISIRVE